MPGSEVLAPQKLLNERREGRVYKFSPYSAHLDDVAAHLHIDDDLPITSCRDELPWDDDLSKQKAFEDIHAGAFVDGGKHNCDGKQVLQAITATTAARRNIENPDVKKQCNIMLRSSTPPPSPLPNQQ
jgi:hypothetical protein